MRELKFRAWRPSSSDMMPNNDLLSIIDLSASLCGLANPDEVLWMQFTGLHDYDGVEMYEDDVAKVEGLGKCVVAICPNYGVIFIDWEGQEVPVIDCISEQDQFRIIGNVHHNPEWLN